METYMNTCKTKTHRWLIGVVAVLFVLAGSASPAFAGDDDDDNGMMATGFFSGWEAELEVGYVSRYVEDGEEEFENGAYLAEVELSKEFEPVGEFFIGAEGSFGASENFTEAELFFGVEREIVTDLEGAISYIWFHESPHEGTGDEFDINLEYGGLEWVDLDAGMTQDFANGGALFRLGIGKEFELWGIEITPHIGVFYDSGYVSEEYDGLNHIQYEIAAEWEFAEHATLEMVIGYVKAQKNLTREEEEEAGEEDEDDNGPAMMPAGGNGHDDEEEEGSVNDVAWIGFSIGYEF